MRGGIPKRRQRLAQRRKQQRVVEDARIDLPGGGEHDEDGEAAHPRLLADGGTVVWKGYVNILRSGNYRFQANLRGKFRLTVGGKEVLAGDVQDELPALKDGAEVRLESGVAPLVAEYTRRLAPGSYLVICHACRDEQPRLATSFETVYNRRVTRSG